MAHRTARLNVYGRELLVTRVLIEGWTVSTAARAQGISRATGYKWVRRFRAEGRAGLIDRSSRPRRSPRATSALEVERIVRARTELRWGPNRLGPYLGHPTSTVAAVLRRTHVPRLADIDRPTGLPVRRYEVCHPGSLIHQDHKKLGRIPDGGGHRVLGRAEAPHSHHAGLGYDHFEVIIDDRSRRSVVVSVPDETGTSAASALQTALAIFAAEGISVERVMTDDGPAYRSNAYRAVLGGRRHSRTRPYRPQTNGKAERFIGTLVREWAYSRPYRSNSERLDALPEWLDFYNRRRP
ncbi:MAG TPA: IS481 family transposase, partial [Candidatus Limnocylindrales bacterium]